MKRFKVIFMRNGMALFIIGLLLVSACAQGGVTPKQTTTSSTSAEELGTSQELKKFGSAEELKEFLGERAGESYAYGGGRGEIMMAFSESGAMDMAVSAPTAMPSASVKMAGGSDGAADYSTTNVQVEGVDEADFVKNDDKYIYMLSGDNLLIVEAYPAEDAEILSKTDIDGVPRDLFLNGDKVVVFVDRNTYRYAIPEFQIMPQPRYTNQLYMIVYDVSDRAEPKIEHEFSMDGRYLQSRMIGDHVYFLVQENVNYYDYYPNMPMIREGDKIVIQPDIYYFDNPENDYQFTTVASLNLESGDVDAKSYLMGYASTVYVSEENLYVTYQQNLPYTHYEEQQEEQFWEVVVPLLPSDIRSEVKDVKGSGENRHEEWAKVSVILQRMYSEMGDNEKERFVDKMNEALQEWEWARERERQKTIVQKFSIDQGSIEHVAQGAVEGQLLNQFSLDEHKGNLRVATTTYLYSRQGSTMHNNVYVLDESMEEIGKLEELAEDERIYSTRFMGDRLYMVTFKNIDPLFVIDLANPRRPFVLGELKIPGFSDYLHPMGNDYLIGVGKDTKENEWGGVSLNGVKIALFDVSDVTRPKQVDTMLIGGPGSTTEASQDHKAFLFDDEKDLLVLPIREIKDDWRWESQWNYRTNRVWQGAYVLTVTEDGFEQRGKVTHYEGSQESRWYWGGPYAVTRSLFMDDVLYTISQQRIEMHDLDTVEAVGAVKLPYSEPVYRDYPMPFFAEGDMMVENVAVEPVMVR